MVTPPPWPWHHDTYFYYLVTIGIDQTNHLELSRPVLQTYNQAALRVHYFGLNILAIFTKAVTGISHKSTMLYVPTFLGPIMYLGIHIFSREFLDRRYALAASFWYSVIYVGINWNIHFQPWGYGMALFPFLLLILFRVSSGSDEGRRFVCLFLALTPGLAVSHRFFTPSIIVLLIGAAIVYWFSRSILSISPIQVIDNNKNEMVKPVILTILVGTSIVSILFFGRGWGPFFNKLVVALLPQSTQEGVAVGVTVGRDPYINHNGASIINQSTLLIKIILGLYIALAILENIYKGINKRRLFFFSILTSSVLLYFSGFLLDDPSRALTIILMLAFPAAFMGMQTLEESILRHRNLIVRGIRVGLVLLVTAGVLAGVTPSFIDSSADISRDGYHNVEPIEDQAPVAGIWLGQYLPQEATLFTIYRHRAIGYFYARGLDGIAPHTSYRSQPRKLDYALYDYARLPRPDYHTSYLYSNGRIFITN